MEFTATFGLDPRGSNSSVTYTAGKRIKHSEITESYSETRGHVWLCQDCWQNQQDKDSVVIWALQGAQWAIDKSKTLVARDEVELGSLLSLAGFYTWARQPLQDLSVKDLNELIKLAGIEEYEDDGLLLELDRRGIEAPDQYIHSLRNPKSPLPYVLGAIGLAFVVVLYLR